MSINNLWKETHGNFQNVMIPITMFDGKFEKELGLKESQDAHIKVLKEKVPHLIEDIFYVHNNAFTYFVYEKKFVQTEVYTLDWDFWESFHIQERIEHLSKEMNLAEKEKDYETIFGMMEKRILIPNYIKYFKKIPIKQKYNCFRDLWKRSEYGFDLFDDVLLKEIFAYRSYSEERKEEMEELIEETNNEKYVTIYRGVTDKSTPIDKGISWTLDIKTAEFFAKRFNSDGDIYKATIDVEYIYDYLPSRSEKEVLINPSKVFDIEKVN